MGLSCRVLRMDGCREGLFALCFLRQYIAFPFLVILHQAGIEFVKLRDIANYCRSGYTEFLFQVGTVKRAVLANMGLDEVHAVFNLVSHFGSIKFTSATRAWVSRFPSRV